MLFSPWQLIFSTCRFIERALFHLGTFFDRTSEPQDLRDVALIFQDPVIIPYWRYNSGGSTFSRVTNSSNILSEVASLVANSDPDFASFQPELAVIVTWHRLQLFIAGSSVSHYTMEPQSRAHMHLSTHLLECK